MDATQIIDALGGKHEVSRLTGATPNAVTQWRRIGVPSRYWPELVEHAQEKGVAGVTFDALRTSKPAAATEVAA